MNGQVEQLNYAIHRLDQSTQRMQADYDARLSKLEAASQQQPSVVTASPEASIPLPTQQPAQRQSVTVNTVDTSAAPVAPTAPVNGTLRR